MSTAGPRSPESILLPDTGATERAGRALGYALEAVQGAKRAGDPVVVGLAGGLGAGKTTIARSSLRALGVEGAVRSPTYTIAEPYETRIGCIWHLDLYRIAAPDELHYIAIRDLVSESAVCLVEWPERGQGELPALDILLTMTPAAAGRRLRSVARSVRGHSIGCCLHASMRREPDR